MNIFKSLFGVVAAITIIVLLGCFFTVQQGQKALVLQMGRFVKNPVTDKAEVYGPGLHFKFPFINQVRAFDARLQTMDVQSSRILTKEQKYVLVDYYVKWRISDLPLFYKTTHGQPLRAESILQQKINDALRAAFGDRQLSEVVSGERVEVMNKLLQEAEAGAVNLGLDVLDVRIKRIDLPENVSKSVFHRMRTKREQVAALYRSEGKAKAEKVRADADAEVEVILAKAKQKAAVIRAEGKEKSAKIYAEAYNKDDNFYQFFRSLEVYKQIFSKKNNMIVLSPSSELMKYFNSTSFAKSANASSTR